jgi:hypothetical protein
VFAGDRHARERNSDQPELKIDAHQNALIVAEFLRRVKTSTLVELCGRHNLHKQCLFQERLIRGSSWIEVSVAPRWRIPVSDAF